MTDDTGEQYGPEAREEAERLGGCLPLLIDATLPVFRAGNPRIVNLHARQWRSLMLEMGITAVKAPGSCPFSTDAARGLDDALLGDYRTLFRSLRELELPEVAFGDGAGCATALAKAYLESGGFGVVCSYGGEGGLPDLEELRQTLHVQGTLPLKSGSEKLRRLRELGGLLSGRSLPPAGKAEGPKSAPRAAPSKVLVSARAA
ncbi:MAG: hypothetical protein LBW85_05385 [Deltaproteobacteria bacterium]|jgi:hypothetical protein|nr:hypothetical protein [Deltaproteobacteria bacterium]